MVKQRTKTFMYAEKGKPPSANVFINLSASCVCCSRKKFYRKIFLKASLRGVLISEVLLTASCCIFSARFSEWSILRSCRVSCICYNCSTAALSEELDFQAAYQIVQLDTVKQPYTGFLNTKTCFNTVLALTLDNNMDIQKVEPSLLNCWQFLWSLLEKGKWIFLPPFPPPFSILLHEGCLYLLLLFKEWLIWKPSLISQIVPSPFVLVLISRAPLDSKQKEHGQQKKRETQRTVSWDQLWGIWWLSASLQLCWFCWLEQLNSSKASGPRITFKTQRKKEGQMNGPPSRPLFHSNYYYCSALDTTV